MKPLSFYLSKSVIVNNDIKVFNKNQESINELKSMVSWAFTNDVSELLYLYRNNFTEYPKCEVCKKELMNSFVNGKRGYRRWCSRSCYKLSADWKEQLKITSQDRYGTDHPLSSTIIQNKRKSTNLKKYGVGNPMEWSGPLYAETMIKKYGAASTRHIPEINNRILNTINLQNEILFKDKLISHLEQLEITPISNIEISNRFLIHEFKHSCGKTIESSIDKIHKIRCFDCHRPKNMSKFQYDIETFIVELGVTVIRNDRTIISPLELDIYIPEKNLAIEAHGDYWHCDLHVDKMIHAEKCNKTESRGIQLIQIFESEWTAKGEIIRSMIKSKLGLIKPIYARNLQIINLSQEEEIEFFNKNHLQGYARSSECIGLTDGAIILCAMSFDKPRFNKKYNWELIRYANVLNQSVVGGASKILSKFSNNKTGQLILSYADRRFSNGKLYEALGFEKTSISSPNYWYINFKKWHRLSRYQTQKSKLKRLLGENYIESLSETENMIFNGYRQIFDAGNIVYTRKL